MARHALVSTQKYLLLTMIEISNDVSQLCSSIQRNTKEIAEELGTEVARILDEEEKVINEERTMCVTLKGIKNSWIDTEDT